MLLNVVIQLLVLSASVVHSKKFTAFCAHLLFVHLRMSIHTHNRHTLPVVGQSVEVLCSAVSHLIVAVHICALSLSQTTSVTSDL